MTAKKTSKKQVRKHAWARLTNDELLQKRICDLGLSLEDSALVPRIEELYRELQRCGFRFRPHFWLSDEWYCPDGIPGVAIPFFLAHPRLQKLEKHFMMEVEGKSHNWFMKLLRHETGHALLNAYKLDERRDWRKYFGRPNARYPDVYLPKPYSKRFVINLPNWYAQAHPHEDWAETFAVWLNPRSQWRQRYRKWPAMQKLEYVDGLMEEIKQKAPRLRNKQTDHPLSKIKMTLGEYYQDKIDRYGMDSPEFSDFDLRKLFVEPGKAPDAEKAAHYIKRTRREVMDIVERWSGEYKYRINTVLQDMVKRCD
ncbi:MAG: putative zinc-binding metallopeptidase, partial [Thioalkalispiraceae bacterium]